jgi:hypothetical protein
MIRAAACRIRRIVEVVADLAPGRLRVALRPPRPRFDRVQAAGLVTGDETVQMLAGVAVLGGRGRDRK